VRTFQEIQSELSTATLTNDAAALRELAQELRVLGTDYAQGAAFNALGVADYFTGDLPSALEHYHRALGILEMVDSRDDAAIVTGNIGNVYLMTSDYLLALEKYRRALSIFEDLGDRKSAAMTIGNIGSVYLKTGDLTSALEHYSRALSLYEELDDRFGIAAVIANMGDLFKANDDYPSALEHYNRALSMLEELGAGLDVAGLTGNIIEILLLQNNYSEAIEVLDRQAVMQMDHPAIRAKHVAHRANILEQNGDLGSARDQLSKALNIALESGLREDAAEYHELLRNLAKKRNDLADYVHHNDEYLRITEEVHGKEATQKMAMMEAERRMEAERLERDKERALLYGALPESVATRMLRGEDVSGDHYENVAVLFLDIAGFTAISDRIPAGHVVHLLKAIFRVCDEACKAHGLTKIKTIGDSYLAVAFPETEGGGPKTEDRGPKTEDQGPKTHHTENAAKAAVEMLQKLNALELTMDPTLGDTSWTQDVGEIRVRIGLHCGPIVAGVVGDERLQYDVWGDTVNVASRMESTGEPGRIHVSSAFAQTLRGPGGTGGDRKGPEAMGFVLRERGTVEVKGKGAMATFWLEPA
jgi:adenylate cyclase